MKKAPSKKTTNTPIAPFNPFFTALNGITALFSGALSVGIVILVVNAVINMTSFNTSTDAQENPASPFQDAYNQFTSLDPAALFGIGAIVLVIIAFSIVVGSMVHGIQSYTALKIAKHEKTTIGEAFSAVLSQFGNYILLYLWMNLKIFLWTLLLIVPGIIAYYRYSFAGIVFFDKGLRLDKAIQESNRLTKGGVTTLFSSHMLFNIITLGYIDLVIWIASTSQLYREYTELDAAKRDKPSIHWLSWVTIALPFVFLLLAILFFVAIAIVVGLTGGKLPTV